MPEDLRSAVIWWAHASPLSCHPGGKRTLFQVRQRFWWTSMARDVQEYVSVCPTFAQNKGSNSPTAGLLRPLPTPDRPWSHICMDFLTGLPTIEGNTVILTVVDRFSKMVHFVPLPKLPSARETAEIILHHVVQLHGFPQDSFRLRTAICLPFLEGVTAW